MHILNQKEAWEVCSQWPLLLGLYFLIDIIQVCWLIFSGDTSNQAESHPSVDRVPNLGRNTCNAVTRILGRHVPWWNKWHDVAMYVLWQLATKSCKTGCYKWNNFKKRNCLAGFQPLSILFNIISYKDSFKGLRAQEIASRNISNRLQSFGYQLRITNMVYPVSYWNLSSLHCRYVYHIYIYIILSYLVSFTYKAAVISVWCSVGEANDTVQIWRWRVGLGIHLVLVKDQESKSLLDGLYFSTVTLSTVGYGALAPSKDAR